MQNDCSRVFNFRCKNKNKQITQTSVQSRVMESITLLAIGKSRLLGTSRRFVTSAFPSTLNWVVVFDGTAPEKTGPEDGTKFCGPRKMLQTSKNLLIFGMYIIYRAIF